MHRGFYLLTTAVALVATTQAYAGTKGADAVPATDTVPAADTAPAATDVAPAADTADSEIVVLGFGRSRQVQSVSQADIARLVPGTSPLKAIEKLPGVNFQAADPFGAYEWAVRISLRGFNQNQLGFTLDDVPLGDMSYGNVNGLHISRAIISENVASTEVAQGAGALGTASTSNLGGTIQFHSLMPSDKSGISVSGTYGADTTGRAYVRLDSGDLGGGLKGYISYAYLHADKWKGAGPQRQHQANAKLMKDLGDAGSITAFVNFSDRRETDYQDLSYDIIARRGLRDDNLTGQYALANQIAKAYQNQTAAAAGKPLPWPGAGTTFPAGFGTVDDAYYDAGGLRRDWLTGLTLDQHLTSALSLKTTGYYHNNKGQGSWITPYSATPQGALGQDGTTIANPGPMSFRTTEYSIHRGGVISALTLETGPNTLQAGGWLEANSFRQARRLYGMGDGDTPTRATLSFQENPYFTSWYGQYNTTTYQYHVEDTLKLFDDRLTLNGGWKGVKVVNQANMLVQGGLASGQIKAKDWFQPQAGLVFRLTPQAELFADYTENMRAFVSSATSGPFATSQTGFDGIRGDLKPERSKTVEGGVRYRNGRFQGSAVGYYVDFTNRLLAFANGVGILGKVSTLYNVGSVRTYGAELTANYRILPPLSLFASYSYTNSTYRDDINAATVVPTKGKTTVDTPKHMVKGEIVYDDNRFMARIGADYMSKRFFTYLNDQSVPDRVLVDASIGYTFREGGALNGLSLIASVTNLTDKKYIATVGSNGFTASGDNQTLLAGAPRQWFVTVKKAF
ncbi:TonB-dependent receptor [Sphingomonas morindae]|uniref:TonB-dependent receptor n=1 Tax=Sphingomonas morindae TaxID=1541170 RepID=A0ABY4XAR1_9SPHN|nr:TonB-dependent receptor [Sphingomonas morindae]USI73979.1 TonB-dependent receptor [Sphingomonas morindae]